MKTKKFNFKFIIAVLVTNILFSLFFNSDNTSEVEISQKFTKKDFVKFKISGTSFVPFKLHKKVLIYSKRSLSGIAYTAYLSEAESIKEENSFLADEDNSSEKIEIYINKSDIAKISHWKKAYIFPFHKQNIQPNKRISYEISI